MNIWIYVTSLLCAGSLGVCGWGYQRSRKLGYLVLVASFVLSLVQLVRVAVQVGQMPTQWETREPVAAGTNAVESPENDVPSKYSNPPPARPVVVSHRSSLATRVPIGALCMTVGLWLLARGEAPKVSPPVSPTVPEA